MLFYGSFIYNKNAPESEASVKEVHVSGVSDLKF